MANYYYPSLGTELVVKYNIKLYTKVYRALTLPMAGFRRSGKITVLDTNTGACRGIVVDHVAQSGVRYTDLPA
jgi:hypothetical protein